MRAGGSRQGGLDQREGTQRALPVNGDKVNTRNLTQSRVLSEPAHLSFDLKRVNLKLREPNTSKDVWQTRVANSSQSDQDPARAELITVIIPTKNRPDDLLIVFRDLLTQTAPPSQIIIVDQSESDEGRLLLEREFTESPENIRASVKLDYVGDSRIVGGATARNRAMEIALGSVWLFLDDDVELEDDFIEQLLRVYSARPDAGGVSGIITNYLPPGFAFRLWTSIFVHGPFHDERQPIYWRANELRRAEPMRVCKFTGAVMSFRAPIVRNFRFDPNLSGVSLAEDIDFCMRLPETVLLIAPRARLVHKRSRIGRAQDHWLRSEVQAACYLYSRNWRFGLWNRVYFIWLNVGFALIVAMLCAKRRSFDPWRSFAAGKRAAAEILQPDRSAGLASRR